MPTGKLRCCSKPAKDQLLPKSSWPSTTAQRSTAFRETNYSTLDEEAFRCAWERLVGSDMLRGNLLGDMGAWELPLLLYLVPFRSPGGSCAGPVSTSMLLRLLDRSLDVERSDRTCTRARAGEHGLRCHGDLVPHAVSCLQKLCARDTHVAACCR